MVTCQLKDVNYHGNCEQCNDRLYCMLSEVMEKLHKMETELAELKNSPLK